MNTQTLTALLVENFRSQAPKLDPFTKTATALDILGRALGHISKRRKKADEDARQILRVAVLAVAADGNELLLAEVRNLLLPGPLVASGKPFRVPLSIQ